MYRNTKGPSVTFAVHTNPRPDLASYVTLSTIANGFFTATRLYGFGDETETPTRHLFLKTQDGVACLSEDLSKGASPRFWPKGWTIGSGAIAYDDIPVYGYRPVEALDISVTVPA